MKTFKQIIGERIGEARSKLGLSQGEIAAMLCVDQSRISRWETGKNLPSGERRKNLLEILNASENEIFMPEVTVTMPNGEEIPPSSLAPERAAEILQELDIVLRRYARAPLELRLLALYVLTGKESYLARYEKLPGSDPIVSEVLRTCVSAS